jgi:hypothetical protein
LFEVFLHIHGTLESLAKVVKMKAEVGINLWAEILRWRIFIGRGLYSSMAKRSCES